MTDVNDILRSSFGVEVNRLPTINIPGAPQKLGSIAYSYTTEEEIRKRVQEAVKHLSKKAPETPDVEKWTLALIETARRAGRLMTKQQFEDWQSKRWLRVGDLALYIGPEREERVSELETYTRPSGQQGHISLIEEPKREERIITFTPSSGDPIVNLEVREFTSGWLVLERIPDVLKP